MSDVTLLSTRGCYYQVDGSAASSAWSMSPGFSFACPVLIQNASISGRDAVSKIVCFNDIRIAAATSRDFGSVDVQGIALLGSVKNTASFGAGFRAWFQNNRIYRTGRSCMISSAPSGAHAFLLEYYQLPNIDVEFNIQHFSFGGACLD